MHVRSLTFEGSAEIVILIVAAHREFLCWSGKDVQCEGAKGAREGNAARPPSSQTES